MTLHELAKAILSAFLKFLHAHAHRLITLITHGVTKKCNEYHVY